MWLTVNITTTLLNKSIFVFFSFPHPLFLSAVHMLCTWWFARFFIWSKGIGKPDSESRARLPEVSPGHEEHRTEMGLKPIGDAELAESLQAWNLQVSCLSCKTEGITPPKLLCLSALFTANILVSNYSLQWVSVSLMQVIRATIPGITMGLTFLLFQTRYPTPVVRTVILICLSVMLATYGEVDLHLVGTLVAFGGCALSALKSVMTKRYLSTTVHPLELLAKMSMMAFFQMAFLAWLVGDFEPWMRFDSGYWNTELILVLLINGAMAFALNYSNFMFTKTTSALTVTVAGNVKNILTIFLSILTFHHPLSPLNLAGTLVTMALAFYYSYLEYSSKV